MKMYPTIAEALTLGGSKLAVDGVVLIGEHGKYPRNEKGQTLYPRYEFFKEIVKVFEDSGRAVPMFNDKHLSWNWDWAKEMYDTAREMGFPLMAGSSLPVTWRTPSLEMPLGAKIKEAVCVCYGGVDSYDFHGLETLQCMVERRKGGETGVKWVQAYRGDAFWKAYEKASGRSARRRRAVPQPHAEAGARRLQRHLPTVEEMQRLVKNPVAYRYEHNDGLNQHHDADVRPGRRLQLRRHVDGHRHLLDADVSADAAGAHDPGELLQPAGEQHRDRCSSPASPRIRSSGRCSPPD